MTRKIITTLVLIVVIVAGSVTAYRATQSDKESDSDKLRVSASFYPVYDFAKQVGGDKISATNITPPGAEPHDYEPSPQELVEAHKSDLFIYNGGQMEPWVDSFLEDYKGTVVIAGKGIEMIENENHHDHDDHSEHGHGHGPSDPHYWLDPVLAQQIVNNIRDGLIEVDAANESYYTNNASDYNQKLVEIGDSFETGLASCTLDTAISSHGAFGYLAHRYDFHMESIAGIEPDDEPSPAKMAELTDIVNQKGIKYIFFESLVSPRLAETIASETGAETLIFDPIEGLRAADQDAGRNYISVQYDNLRNLQTALNCN